MRNQYNSDRQSRRDFQRGRNYHRRFDSDRGSMRRSDRSDESIARSFDRNYDRDFDREDSSRRYSAGGYDNDNYRGETYRSGDRGTSMGSRGSSYGSQDFSYGSSASFPNTGYETGSRGWDEMRGSDYGVYDIGGQGAGGYGRVANENYDDMLDRRDWRADNEARNWRLERDMRHHERGLFERLGEKVGEFFGKGPKGYRRSDDRIREDISEALYNHPRIDASEVEVQVSEGIVTLTGTVTERAQKRMIEDVAERVSGVKDVTNNIRLTESSSSSMSSFPSSSQSEGASRMGTMSEESRGSSKSSSGKRIQ